jgi:hypothetical protein
LLPSGGKNWFKLHLIAAVYQAIETGTNVSVFAENAKKAIASASPIRVGYIPGIHESQRVRGIFASAKVNQAASQSQFGDLPAHFPSVR